MEFEQFRILEQLLSETNHLLREILRELIDQNPPETFDLPISATIKAQ